MRTIISTFRTCTAVAALVVVAACGGGSDSDGPTIQETTASATPTPTATTPTVAERPTDERSDAGAIAFSAYAVQSIVATTGGASLDDFLKIAIDSCKGCITLAKDIGENPTEVQRFDGPAAIDGASIVKKDGADYVVEQTVSVPAGQKVKTADSSVVSEIAPAAYRWVLRATWKDDRWYVADYAVEKSS